MKPIPPNRRWNGGANGASQPPASNNPNPFEAIVICELNLSSDEDCDAFEPLEEDFCEVIIAPLAIPARYRSTCRACLQPIRVGDAIVRHAQAGCWVHQACYDHPLRSTARPLIVAQYDGYCRICHGGIRAGELITRVQGRGWVHAHCVED